MAGRDELTVDELLGVGLDTDLAVLSACDSGRGDITATGDVVGLARGLLAACSLLGCGMSWCPSGPSMTGLGA